MDNKVEYDPNIHCCRDWDKDFCECVKASFAKYRKDVRDARVEATLKFLETHNIPYKPSKTQNVVIIEGFHCGQVANLSLKGERNLFKLRFKGNSVWYRYSKKGFLERFKHVD